LECYFCGVIENNLKISRAKAAEWLTKEFITHPHGTLGKYRGERLNWLSDRRDQYTRIKKALDGIVVISEANPKTASYAKARKLLEVSQNYVFLGFGYHSQNMERLGFPNICKKQNRDIYASHKGVPKSEWWNICKYDFSADNLFGQNWPSLSRIVSLPIFR
jgi:hypothetical protein